MRWIEILTDKYFADSYALIEMLKGKESYTPYRKAQQVFLKVNLAECIYALLKLGKYEQNIISLLSPSIIPLSTSAIITGMKLKYQLRKRKLSYIDCLGYATACELNIPFLTGDNEFKDLPGVEFVC